MLPVIEDLRQEYMAFVFFIARVLVQATLAAASM